uniref:BolA family member 3 n=1 Tax=Aquila chrysaetos chrysaetos TaxID=223781 RepID=A0A663E6V9_AQUCH
MAAAAGLLCRGPLFLRRGTWRSFTSQTEGEARVTRVLREKFPRASAIKVVDISGGCGAMYEIHIESEDFKEKRTVQQHQMVNQVRGGSGFVSECVQHLTLVLCVLRSELSLPPAALCSRAQHFSSACAVCAHVQSVCTNKVLWAQLRVLHAQGECLEWRSSSFQ